MDEKAKDSTEEKDGNNLAYADINSPTNHPDVPAGLNKS